MEKDEVIFTLGMVKSMYPQIWKDSPEEIQKFIKDVYSIELNVEIIKELYDEQIYEEDEYRLIFENI
tara:strand:- start:1781 stop:1981 length:201 start_codon:yes stop_codon:yes gene_type:complete